MGGDLVPPGCTEGCGLLGWSDRGDVEPLLGGFCEAGCERVRIQPRRGELLANRPLPVGVDDVVGA
jgi:hypothetical protein